MATKQTAIVKVSEIPLINSIKKGDLLAISETADRYMTPNGIDYEGVLSIAPSRRIPALVNQMGKKSVHALLVVLLKGFFSQLTLRKEITDDQIVIIAHDLLTTSYEDSLALEDFVIFFKGARTGRFGKIYDILNEAELFDMMEVYRQARYSENRRIKCELEANYKVKGITERECDKYTEDKDVKKILLERMKKNLL